MTETSTAFPPLRKRNVAPMPDTVNRTPSRPYVLGTKRLELRGDRTRLKGLLPPPGAPGSG